VKVYVRRIKKTTEKTTKEITDTHLIKRHFKQQTVTETEGPVLHDVKEQTQVEEEKFWGYQIVARDIKSFVSDVRAWNPLMTAYHDMHEEFKWALDCRRREIDGEPP
jgi:hypothetical protein